MAVLVRIDSTKDSRTPFRAGSFSGSPTERFSSVGTGRVSASARPGKNRAQLPRIRSLTTSSRAVLRLAARLYSAPYWSRENSSSSGARLRAGSWARGRRI